MPSDILAIGTGAASSADQVVAAGTPVTYCLKDAAGPVVSDTAIVRVELKAETGEYFQVDTLSGVKPAIMIVAAGTYRFRRTADSDSCGVFSG